MKTLKYIIKNIPKTIRVIIGAVIFMPIATYIVVQFATNSRLDLSFTNLLYLLTSIFILTFIGYTIGSFRSVKELINASFKTDIVSEKKVLPHLYVSIGTFESNNLSVVIRAKILLNEIIKPRVDVFLDRVYEGDPFCPKCFRQLDEWNGNWQIDYVQLGYKCPDCDTKYKGDWQDIRKSIKGKIRENYDEYWNNYSEQINELTYGKPSEYKLL